VDGFALFAECDANDAVSTTEELALLAASCGSISEAVVTLLTGINFGVAAVRLWGNTGYLCLK
jgi:hypothetical protein